MGCWEETCAITETPIFEGQSCVMVVLDKLVKDYMPFDCIKRVHGIHKGTYDEHGWIREIDIDYYYPDIQEKYKRWHAILGNKNRIFFHRFAWDKINHFMADESVDFADVFKSNLFELDEKEVQEFSKMLIFSGITRRDIMSSERFTGSQAVYQTTGHFDLVADLIKQQCHLMKDYLGDGDGDDDE